MRRTPNKQKWARVICFIQATLPVKRYVCFLHVNVKGKEEWVVYESLHDSCISVLTCVGGGVEYVGEYVE